MKKKLLARFMRKSSIVFGLTCLMLVTAIGSASAILLPTPDCGFGPGNTCLVQDDFVVFSMAFLQYNLTGDLTPGPGDEYYVASSPGQIKTDIVIGTSPAAAEDNHDVATNVDDAYDTPNSGGGGTSSALFAMLGPDPYSSFLGDNIQMGNTLLPNPDNLDIDGDGIGEGNLNGQLPLWDVRVDDLKAAIGEGSDLLFFFNLNDSNPGGLENGQDLLAYMDVYLTNSTTGASVKFTMSGANTAQPAIQAYAQETNKTTILPTANDLWAYVHAEVCVDSTNGAVLALSSCSAAGNPANGVTINNALGADTAAFALWNEDLNIAFRSGLYDVLTVDGRMAYIDNGYEQLFIMPARVHREPPGGVPEPATMLLLGTGLIGVAGTARRKKKN